MMIEITEEMGYEREIAAENSYSKRERSDSSVELGECLYKKKRTLKGDEELQTSACGVLRRSPFELHDFLNAISLTTASRLPTSSHHPYQSLLRHLTFPPRPSPSGKDSN